jgi:glycosyltransferase involved in cell wall biosynthesis
VLERAVLERAVIVTSGLLIPPGPKPGLRRVQRHIITPEYPPQPGGVSDYTAQVAGGLAQAGEEVHVWCPRSHATSLPGQVQIHGELGGVEERDLRAMGEQLDRFPAPRRILVQWVPHGYGRRSLNVPFCLWLSRRASRHGDILEIMVHEAFLNFEGSWRQYGAAAIHRLMAVILLRNATRVWVSIPECERRMKPYALGRKVPFQWLPIPSNIGVAPGGIAPEGMARDAAATGDLRRRYSPQGGLLVGHFGTFGAPLVSVLDPILLHMADEIPGQPLLLMGVGSREFRKRVIEQYPGWENNLYATGPLAPEDLSAHIAACDLLIQPYPDGATTRRTSLMAGLSHGKAILTTSSKVTEPLWERSAAVSLTPAGDAAAFVQRLHELLQNPAERGRMSRAARRLYQERFDIFHTVEALRMSAAETIVCAS